MVVDAAFKCLSEKGSKPNLLKKKKKMRQSFKREKVRQCRAGYHQTTLRGKQAKKKQKDERASPWKSSQ